MFVLLRKRFLHDAWFAVVVAMTSTSVLISARVPEVIVLVAIIVSIMAVMMLVIVVLTAGVITWIII